MKIFVAGASGAIGRALVPLLAEAGHAVVGMTRNPANVERLRALGATPVVVDAYDRAGLLAAVQAARPDVVMHQLTDLTARDMAANTRLRVEGTRNLVDAALAAAVERIVAQSLAFAYAPGPGPATEDTPLDLDAPPPQRGPAPGVYALEQAVAALPEAVVLRYGVLYGPGTWYAPDGWIAEEVRRGVRPATEGITSFIHVADAARAALLALDWPAGPINIVDDEPAPGTAWLPVYAEVLGAPPPPFQPGAGRGERGASNAKARREYGWQPLYPTWRVGFRIALG